MQGSQAAALLGSFIVERRERILRRLLKGVKAEPTDERPLDDVRAEQALLVDELSSALSEHGDEAPRYFAEAVRERAGVHYSQGLDIGASIAAMADLQQAIAEEWQKSVGDMEHEVQALLCDCALDASASAATGYVRRLRTDRRELGEGALIEAIVAHLDAGLLVVEADGTLTFASRPAVQLLGREVESLLGRPVQDEKWNDFLARLRVTSLDGRPLKMADLHIERVFATGKAAHQQLLRMRRGGEEERVLELDALPIWTGEAEGEPGPDELRGVLVVLRDRTSEIRKAEELRGAYKELTTLHQRLLHRSRAQAMGELATGASHALNNLLNAMHLRLQLLEENPAPEHIAALRRSVQDIATLVARLQQFTGRRSAGPPEPVNLDRVVEETLELVRPEMPGEQARQLRVVQSLHSPEPVLANAAELREVLAAVLLYAREYVAPGSKLFVTTSSADRPGEEDRIECRIRFRGVKAPAAEVEHELEPFTESEAPPALDLVVASARDALSRWDGRVVARALATGEMEIVLSLKETKAAQVARGPQPSVPSGRRTILVIDDDADNAAMLAQVLEGEGHEVSTATSGREALSRWRERSFDVALVDVVMPDMSGLDIARGLHEARPSARLALVTGWELDSAQREGLPVEEVFRKPVDLDRLLAFISPSASAEAHV